MTEPGSGLEPRIAALTGRDVRSVRVTGGQHGSAHAEVTFADETKAFAKLGGPSPHAEANGLRWLAASGAVPVPEVLAVDQSTLVIAMVPADPRGPDRNAAFGFGAALARLHAAGADSFGAPWPGVIASLPLDNTQADAWPRWYAERRLLPYLHQADLDKADTRLITEVIDRIEDLAGPQEPPSRIHGDLWSGNLLWSGGQGWLIDPAAHGGHRETDLAMLALFGAPHLDAIIDGYQSVAPLAEGWRSRIPLHQLHPLLVHVCLFGQSYASPLRQAARTTLNAPTTSW